MHVCLRRTLTCAAVSLALILAGCSTLKSDAQKEQDEAAKHIPFEPVSFVSRLHAGEGPYPNLFAGESQALWVGPEVTQQRRAEASEAGEAITAETDAAVLDAAENYLVIELHVVSAFPDMGKGYDAVGLRNVECYLLTPDGRKVQPATTIRGEELDEKQESAIREFGKTHLLAFSRRDLELRVPKADPEGATARLVLAAYGTSFYFEWFPLVPEGLLPPLPEFSRVSGALKMRYREYAEKVRRIGHRLD